MTHGLLEASLLSAELSLSLYRSEDHNAEYTSLSNAHTQKMKQTEGDSSRTRTRTCSQDQLYRSPIRVRPLSGSYTHPVGSASGTRQSSGEVSVSTSNASSEKGPKSRSLTPTQQDLSLLSSTFSSSSSLLKSRYRETDVGSSTGVGVGVGVVVRPPSLSIDSSLSQQCLDKNKERAREIEREKEREDKFHRLSFRTFHHLGGSNSRPASPLHKQHSGGALDSSPIHTPLEHYESRPYSREGSLADLQSGGSAWRNTSYSFSSSSSVYPSHPHANAAADTDSAVCVTGALTDDVRHTSASSNSGLDAYANSILGATRYALM